MTETIDQKYERLMEKAERYLNKPNQMTALIYNSGSALYKARLNGQAEPKLKELDELILALEEEK